MIEKHFTLSKLMYGSDARNSTEPEEFKRLVSDIRSVEIALASRVDKNVKVKELAEMKTIFEKSIVAAKELTEGHMIRYEDMAFKKPGNGIPARQFRELIGRVLKQNMKLDDQFTMEKFEE